MDTGSERTITPQIKSWKAVRWAHDDRSLLVMGTGADGKHGVYRVSDGTGDAELVAELPVDTRSFTPSRDGRTIYHGTLKQTLARDLATGSDKRLSKGQRRQLRSACVS
jgi:hypothetical protein